MVAPTNQRGAVYQFAWSFDGTNSANTPGTQIILRQTTAGTATNTAVAPKKINDPSGVGETLQFTYQTAYTVEPTASDVMMEFTQPVFGGLLSQAFAPWSSEIMIPGGTRLGFKSSCAQTVNAGLTVWYEE